jgi:mRNA-degrading endonuclease YafQ of YafQ-DinJ toxin-antitoxin module
MTPSFSIRTTPRFERVFRTLLKRHPELVDRYAEALTILTRDPYNRSRRHQILKLEGIPHGEG